MLLWLTISIITFRSQKLTTCIQIQLPHKIKSYILCEWKIPKHPHHRIDRCILYSCDIHPHRIVLCKIFICNFDMIHKGTIEFIYLPIPNQKFLMLFPFSIYAISILKTQYSVCMNIWNNLVKMYYRIVYSIDIEANFARHGIIETNIEVSAICILCTLYSPNIRSLFQVELFIFPF